MTNIQTINWFATAGTLRAAFSEEFREPDSHGNASSFWTCKPAWPADQSEPTELLEFIRDLHDDELPNDWRYATIVAILDALMEVSGEEIDWDEQVNQIADSLTSVCNAELAAWIAENGSRATYHDNAVEEGLISDGCLSHRLSIAQYQCIYHMAYRIVQKLNLI